MRRANRRQYQGAQAARQEDIAALEAERKEVLAAITAFEAKARPVLRKIRKSLEAEAPEVCDFDWPEPAEGDDDPDPLFDSTREFVEQVDRYKEHQGKPTKSIRKPYDFAPATCTICGNAFEATNRNKSTTCSANCRETLRYRATIPAPILCAICGDRSDQCAAQRSARRKTAATRRDESLCLSKGRHAEAAHDRRDIHQKESAAARSRRRRSTLEEVTPFAVRQHYRIPGDSAY